MSTFERTIDAGEECVLVVEATSGDIKIIGWDKRAVSAQSHDHEPILREEGSTITVKAGVGGSSDLTVSVPRQCDLSLRLVSGDAEIQDIDGQINLQTMSGDIEGKRLRGDLCLHSVSGDLKVRASQFHSFAVDAVSGDASIESSLDERGTYRLHTVSGDVHLRLPENQEGVVYFGSISGDFKCDLPHTISRQGWGKVVATLGKGGVEVTVRTTSGGLHIGAAGELPEEQHERPVAEPVTVERDTKPLSSSSAAAEPFALDETKPPSGAEAKSAASRRMEVLKAIEEGKMTVSEGLAKLRALE